MRNFAAASALALGFFATIGSAQPITVNGVTCTAANAVTVTYTAGALNIVTGGCGTTTTPPTTLPPTISSLSTSSALPGDPLVINGSNLAGATVTIGAATATTTINTAGTQITTTVPAAASTGAGAVIVTVNGLAPAYFAFTVLPPPSLAAPSITQVTPTSGPAGTAVTITGTKFTGAGVTIGAASASSSVTANTINTTVPAGASIGAGAIIVTVPGFDPAYFAFTVLPPQPPTISSVSQTTAAPGTSITITGTSFVGVTSVKIGGATANITTNSSTLITTTVPSNATVGTGTIVVTTNAGSTSTNFTVIAATVSEVAIDGTTLPNPSKLGNVVGATHQGLNGAGSEVNAYAMDPTRCFATPALTRSWQHNISLSDYTNKHALDYIAMKSGEALTLKFTVSATDGAGGFQYADAAAAGANIRPGYMTISETPCDFDPAKVLTNTSGNGCYVTGINGVTLNWANTTVVLPVNYCRLQTGKTYYLNLRFQDARPASAGGQPNSDSCLNGETCGGILQFF